MKINYYFSSLAMMAMLAACQNDVLDAPVKASDVTVTASREGSGSSRTTLTEDYKINWHADDKLSVFLGSAANTQFTIHEGAGEDYATFKGSGDIFITGGTESGASDFANVAYYPYDANLSIAEGDDGAYTLTATLPSGQTYRNGSFGQDAYPMVAVAESNRDYAFSFKNIGSMFMLYLKGEAEITKIELESKANKLAGACTIKAAYGNDPVITLSDVAESKITLNCTPEDGKGVQLNNVESTVFVISVPPIAGDAEDLTFTIYDANYGYMVYENAAEYSVARNKYYTFGAATAVEYKAAAYTQNYVQDENGNLAIYTAEGMKYFYDQLIAKNTYSGKTVTLMADINMNGVEWVSKTADAYTSFAGTLDGNSKTVSNFTATTSVEGGYATMFNLFSGEVKNLTMENVTATGAFDSDRASALVGYMSKGKLSNVHVKDVVVKGSQKLAGLVSNVPADGGDVTIEGCSVTNFSASKSDIDTDGIVQAGGLIGYAKLNGSTLTVSNCTVNGVTINDETDKYTEDKDMWAYYSHSFIGSVSSSSTEAVVILTGNKIEGAVSSNPTLKVSPRGNDFMGDLTTAGGGFEGKCIIDGVCSVSTSKQLAYVVSQGVTNIKLADGTYQMPAEAKGKTLTISGTNAAIIEVVPAGQGEANGQLDYSLDGSTVTFNGVTIRTNSQLYAGYARLSAVYNDCVIQNTYNLGTGTSEFNRCTFNITDEYLRVGGANSAKFEGCTFNTDGRAILIFQDGTSVAQSVTVKDCIFNATAAATTWNGIHVAAVSIDGTNGSYTVNLEGENTVDSDFNGLWQIKAGETNVTVNETVNE